MQPIQRVTRRRVLERAALAAGAACSARALGETLTAATEPATHPAAPSAAGVKILDAIPPDLSRYDGTVAVWFSSHYQVDQRDWINIKEFGNPYHPLAGYYKSDDPAIIDRQLHWMRRAGIDAIVYDVFSTAVWRLTDLPKDKTLPLLLERLADQQHESRKLKLIIWLERYIGMPTADEYAFAFEYVRKYLAPKDFYFRYHDKPLVVPYLNGTLDENVLKSYRGDLEIQPISAYSKSCWSYIDHYPQCQRKDWMCASPGIDAFLEDAHLSRHVAHSTTPLDQIRAAAQREARDEGATFVKQLAWAKKCNPEIVFFSGWNDWQYGCQIEPAVEYRYLYLDLTAKALGRWNETAVYRDES